MIKVRVYRYSDNTYKGFVVSGHAEYANKGKDIICSAVSFLTINTVNSIEGLTSDKFKFIQKDSGAIKFKFVSNPSHDGQLIIRTFVLGMIMLNKEYGDEYLQVYFKEV